MTPVDLTLAARRDMLHLNAYTAERFGPAQVERNTVAFDRIFQRLAAFPLSGHHREGYDPLERGFRYVTVKRRFTVIYLPHLDRIEVVRIVDASRDLAAVLREL